jgi:peptidoglycan hydrolase-like protein with peptidoglycan-binding domain
VRIVRARATERAADTTSQQAPPGEQRTQPADILRLAGNRAFSASLAVQRDRYSSTGAQRTLRPGMTGEDVAYAQELLSRAAASATPLPRTGVVDTATETAIKAFRRARSIVPAVSPVIDDPVWTALRAAQPTLVQPEVGLGDKGIAVGVAQQKLNAAGSATPRLPITAEFDAPTETAVRAFQTARMPTTAPNGRMDRATWTALDTAVPDGGIYNEGASTTPVQDHVGTGTAPRATAPMVAGTSLHPVIGPAGLTSGPGVLELQQKLNGWLASVPGSTPLAVSGTWNPQTASAVQQFQTSRTPALPTSGSCDAATWAALDAVSPRSTDGAIDRSWTETVGGHTYSMQGARASKYSWHLDIGQMIITAKVKFTNNPPKPAWFTQVRNTWDGFKAQKTDGPQAVLLKFQMVQSADADANVVDVKTGTGRANAGEWYLGDTATDTVPHEFGHLIGLRDEYQLHSADYREITGHEPPTGGAAGVAEPAGGVTPLRVAQDLRAAILARNTANCWHAVVGRGIVSGAFAARVVEAYKTLGPATVPLVPMVPGTATTPAQPARPAVTLGTDVVADLDRAVPDTSGWRYQVIQALTYSSGSIMGDASRVTDPHEHGTQARHVQEFVDIVAANRGGTWVGERSR